MFAEYFHVNEADANMAHIPSAVADDAAVYCSDMISTGVMAAENANIPPGGTVCVFALGPVGLMSVAGRRMRGAGLIIGVDSVARRQELARSYGADVTVDSRRRRRRAHHGIDRWRGRRFGDRGAGLDAFFFRTQSG